MGMDASLTLRKASQNTSAAARFTKVPPAATRGCSDALDHATVVSTPDFAPISRAVRPCPTPSWRTFATVPATMLMATIVSVSSVVRIRSSSCGAVAAVELSGIRLSNYSAYHSECGDHRLQERH